MWLALAFGLGCLLGMALPLLALIFYVNITHPHAIIGVLTVFYGGIAWLMHSKSRLIHSLVTGLCFAVGCYAMMYLLLWGYPPNFS